MQNLIESQNEINSSLCLSRLSQQAGDRMSSTSSRDGRSLHEERQLRIAKAAALNSGVKSILKLYLSKSIVTDGKTTRSKVESID